MNLHFEIYINENKMLFFLVVDIIPRNFIYLFTLPIKIIFLSKLNKLFKCPNHPKLVVHYSIIVAGTTWLYLPNSYYFVTNHLRSSLLPCHIPRFILFYKKLHAILLIYRILVF